MESKWRIYIASELEKANLLRIEDGNHGEYRPRNDEFVDKGIAFIRASDIELGQILFESASRINQTALSRIRKGVGSPGDTLLSSKGTVGKIALAPLTSEPFVCSPQVTFWRSLNNDFLDYRFLFYLIQSSHFWNQVSAMSGETDMAPYISLTNQRKLKLAIPELPEQKAIARILSSLDDKIELNRQMNETLEAIAQTIFKSWFVNFDPVRAKIEGRQPAGMDAATAALFPDELEESSLGQIPKGWKVKAVGDLVDIKHGYAFKGEFFRTEPPGDILLTPGNFARGGGFKDDKFKYYIGEVPEDFVLDEGDLLVSMTDLSKAGDTLGYPALIPPPRKSLYLHNQRLGKVIVKLNVPVSKFHLYYLLRTDEYRHEVLASATGTTVKHTSPDRIKNFKFPFPNNETSLRFGEVIAPMYEKFSANQEESRTLAAIRDTLLPKLMAGEIQVKDLENLAGNIRNPHHHF